MFSKPQTFLKSTYQIIRSSRPRPARSTHAKLLTWAPLTWALLPLHPSPLTVLLPSGHRPRFCLGAFMLAAPSGTPSPAEFPAGSAASLRSLLECPHLGEAFLDTVYGMEHRCLPHLHYLFPSPCFILNYNTPDVMIYSFVHLLVSVTHPHSTGMQANCWGFICVTYRCVLVCRTVPRTSWSVINIW